MLLQLVCLFALLTGVYSLTCLVVHLRLLYDLSAVVLLIGASSLTMCGCSALWRVLALYTLLLGVNL